MLTLSTNIQSYLSVILLSSTTPCFHSSGIFYNYILYSVVLYHLGVAVRECEVCLSFYRIIISEFDLFIAIVGCFSGVNLSFILFLSQL